MEFHTHCHKALELKSSTLVKLFESLGAFRQNSELEGFLLACEADSKGRTGFEQRQYPQSDWLRKAHVAANDVNAVQFIKEGLAGKEIGKAIHDKRVYVIEQLKKESL